MTPITPTTTTPMILEDLRERARRAYYNLSFSPEKRGDQIISDYSKELSDDLQSIPEDQRQRYEENYRKHLSAWIASTSNCASAMITGPARFPTDRMRKRSQWADNKYSAFREWRSNALQAIERKARANRTPEEIHAEHWQKVRATIIDAAATIVQIDTGEARGYARPLFVSVITRTIETNAKNGHPEIVRKALELLKQLNAQGTKPVVTAANKVWKLEQAATVAAEAKVDTAARESEEYTINGIRIVDNYQEDRTQIFFRDKAHAMEHRVQLKGAAWNWSGKNGAWQRKLNGNARFSALKICAGAPIGSFKSELNGKHIQTVIFPTAEQANTFLQNNEMWGVIGEDHYGIHVALNSDNG